MSKHHKEVAVWSDICLGLSCENAHFGGGGNGRGGGGGGGYTLVQIYRGHQIKSDVLILNAVIIDSDKNHLTKKNTNQT